MEIANFFLMLVGLFGLTFLSIVLLFMAFCILMDLRTKLRKALEPVARWIDERM